MTRRGVFALFVRLLSPTVFIAAIINCSSFVLLAAPDRGQAAESPKVWVNTSSGVYHCPGTRYYGATKRGEYMTETAAQKAGRRPASGRVCQSSQSLASIAPEQSQGNPNAKVWVNTSSSVYHCPGTRYYGATKRGEYMTQSTAQKAGHRPASGRVCQ